MSDLAAFIDHTLLKPEATAAQVDRLCDEAVEYGFASACVNGCFVERVAERLAGSSVKVCAVAGFPLGATLPKAIGDEAAALVRRGAQEVDFVGPLRHLMLEETDAAAEAMGRVVEAVRKAGEGVTIKVIVESAALMGGVDAAAGASRIAAGCAAAKRAGCDFVKTSTGFHPAGGATVEAVRLMRKYAGGMKVKAAGGIRSAADAQRMLDAGAERLGCSSGVAMVAGQAAAGSY